MVNIGKILKRSWHILWNYRVLWIFGFLLALTSGGSSGGNNGGSNSRVSWDAGDFPRILPEGTPQWARELHQWFMQTVVPLFTNPEQHIAVFITIGVVILLIALFFGLLAALVRYPSETAVMRMVDEYERSGSKLGFRQGWKLGWTRRAFRLWLIDLVLAIPVFVVVLVLIGVGLVIYFNVPWSPRTTDALAVVAAIGAVFISIFLLIVVGVFLNLLRHFFARAAALDGLGFLGSLKHGWGLFSRNWKSAGLMWLVMVGIGIAFAIAGLIAFFILIPLYLILLIPAVFVAAVPALVAFGVASIFTAGPLAWIIAVIAALPFFFTTVFSPMLLVGGLYRIYTSNVWTLTYREIQALESLAAPGAPAQGDAGPAADAVV